MTGKFDASALLGIEAALSDDSHTVSASEEELRRISGADLRRKCAGIKLAARIIGMASVGRENTSDAEVLSSMEALMTRLTTVRQSVLEIVGAPPDSADYPAVFNSVTNTVIDMLTEEWKWSRLSPGATPLPTTSLNAVLEMASNRGPIYLSADDTGDLKTVRRLCVLEAIPRLWTAVNLFDYYQPEREPMIAVLARAVCEQAEATASVLYSQASPSFAVRTLLKRTYAVSTGLLCEIYKDTAARDVARLRAMPELDRAVLLAQVEHTGMKFSHIISRHRAVMVRTLESINLILEAHHQPPRSPELGHGR